MNDYGLEQTISLVEKISLILTTLPGQFQDIHLPDKLSDHDIVSGNFSSPQ